MTNVETRQVHRDSLFLLAQLRVDGKDEVHRIKVRNLSPGGMMAEGPVNVVRGQLVRVDLRNLGWVEGSVAWKQDNRFGIAFIEEIDPKVARAPHKVEDLPELSTAHRVRPSIEPPVDKERLRKL